MVAGASFGQLSSPDTAPPQRGGRHRFELLVGYEQADGTVVEEDRGHVSVAPFLLDDCLNPTSRVCVATLPDNVPCARPIQAGSGPGSGGRRRCRPGSHGSGVTVNCHRALVILHLNPTKSGQTLGHLGWGFRSAVRLRAMIRVRFQEIRLCRVLPGGGSVAWLVRCVVAAGPRLAVVDLRVRRRGCGTLSRVDRRQGADRRSAPCNGWPDASRPAVGRVRRSRAMR
jgi:hypothetical protein